MDTNEETTNSEYEEFKKYLQQETEEILKYKYIRSEQEGRDMGQEAIVEWIEKYAEEFREYYNNKNNN